MSVSSFAVHRALPAPAAPMYELSSQTPPISSCWGSLHPDILKLVAAHLPSSGDYETVNCATLVCKAWRGQFLSREGVLQPLGVAYNVFSGGPKLTPPESWTRMIFPGGLSCLDLSRLPWADRSPHQPEELLKAANAYAVGIARLAPAGLASLVLWLGEGCKAAPGVVNRYYAPLLLRTLPLLKGLTSLEVPSLSWEGVGPLVSALRQLLAADDCRLSELRLDLRVPTYRDVIGSVAAAEDPAEIAQGPAVQEAMQPFHELRQLFEEHPDLSMSLCAKVTIPDDQMYYPEEIIFGIIRESEYPMGEILEALGGTVTELELRDGCLPPGTLSKLSGVKRLEMIESSGDPDEEDACIRTPAVLDALAGLPALEEVVLVLGGDAVSFPEVVHNGLAHRSTRISYLEVEGFWQQEQGHAVMTAPERERRNTGLIDKGTLETLKLLGLVEEDESLVLMGYNYRRYY